MRCRLRAASRSGGQGRPTTDPHRVTPELRSRLIACWIAVTDSGGAAGFPFPPARRGGDVAPVADGILGRLGPHHSRLITATFDGADDTRDEVLMILDPL